MEQHKVKTKIVSDPNICGGEPCIRDTRIPVYVILSHLAAGEDYDTILKNFPRLKYDDVMSCLEYAAYLSTNRRRICQIPCSDNTKNRGFCKGAEGIPGC